MTRRERVLCAVNHRQADIIPYTVGMTYQAYERLVAYVGDPAYVDNIGSHLATCYYDGYLREIEEGSGYWRDQFGVTWNRNGADKDIGVTEGLILPEPTMAGYKFPEPDEARLRSDYERILSRAGDTCVLGAIGFSMFERAWTLRGMENLLADMIMEPEFVDELLDAVCEHNLKVIDIALGYNIDGFYFGDDWGQQKGLIMGPGYWRRFIKPRMERMYTKVRDAGKFVVQHSCGDIQDIFPDLVDIGLSVYQTFQPEIYDIHAVKRDFGGDLTFWGGISTQRVLPFASPDEVRQVARDTMAAMGAGGGYIAAPTHSIPGDVPAENIVALVEAFQNQ